METHGDIAEVDGRLCVLVDGAWIPLRWWSGGRRLLLDDLDEPEREARRVYMRVKQVERRANRSKDREEKACTQSEAQAAN